MKKETLDYVVQKTEKLIGAHTCYAGLKEMAQKWLAAVGTDQETEMTKVYLAELEADIVTVDALIDLAESEAGAQIFGADAPNVAEHGRSIQAAGAVYCDCPACAAVEAILAKKEEMLE